MGRRSSTWYDWLALRPSKPSPSATAISSSSAKNVSAAAPKPPALVPNSPTRNRPRLALELVQFFLPDHEQCRSNVGTGAATRSEFLGIIIHEGSPIHPLRTV